MLFSLPQLAPAVRGRGRFHGLDRSHKRITVLRPFSYARGLGLVYFEVRKLPGSGIIYKSELADLARCGIFHASQRWGVVAARNQSDL